MEYVPIEMPIEMADLQLQCLITKGIERIFHMCKTVKTMVKTWFLCGSHPSHKESKHHIYIYIIDP